MCIFSGPVSGVAATRIFARGAGDRQLLAYQLQVAIAEPLAMVLPIPTPADSPDDAVGFLDLSGYRTFFTDLETAFDDSADDLELAESFGLALPDDPTLVVHEVGDFVASFVPRLADFARLAPRFRLPDAIWASLPQYRDWGFVVCQLAQLGPQHVHPIAFDYPRRDRRLVFPTVHVHEGTLAPHAHFDHELYAQPGTDAADLSVWRRSRAAAEVEVDVASALGLIDGGAPLWHLGLHGTYPNGDVVIE